MAGAKKGTWVAGAVVAALAIMVASWFLAISPSLAHASDVRSQAAQTRQQNEVLAAKVEKLKADFAKLDTYKAQLAALRAQVPATTDMANYLRQLDGIAAAHKVTITTVAPGAAAAVVPARAAAAPAPAPSASASPTPTASASASSAATASGAAAAGGVPTGMVDIPLSLTVVGTYDDTVAFLNDLQTNTPRLFLVSGFTGTSQDAAQASGGRPKTSLGDQQLQVNGFLYVLPDAPAAAGPTPAPSTTPSLPGAVPGKDPLVPVGGSR